YSIEKENRRAAFPTPAAAAVCSGLLCERFQLRYITEHSNSSLTSEPVYDLLRVGDTALKTSSKCSCTTCTFRFFARFRLVSLLLARL
ncbi:hypothetical protein, partial [Pseudomonas sp. MWU12-2115]|uniref:hypothetical protein n=1 Tax=Pseudomonas sp. MWU12-2115 TaxID=2071713 RepID=UPI001C49AF1B